MPEYFLIGMILAAIALCSPGHTAALRKYVLAEPVPWRTATVVVGLTVLLWPISVVVAMLSWLKR